MNLEKAFMLKSLKFPVKDYFAEKIDAEFNNMKDRTWLFAGDDENERNTGTMVTYEEAAKAVFPTTLHIAFSDNDFGGCIHEACKSFVDEFSIERFYELYQEYGDAKDVANVVKEYIVYAAVGFYIARNARIHYNKADKLVADAERVLEYIQGLVDVSFVEYLPDEITGLERKETIERMNKIFESKGKDREEYLYNLCWNSEDVFIHIDKNERFTTVNIL